MVPRSWLGAGDGLGERGAGCVCSCASCPTLSCSALPGTAPVCGEGEIPSFSRGRTLLGTEECQVGLGGTDLVVGDVAVPEVWEVAGMHSLAAPPWCGLVAMGSQATDRAGLVATGSQATDSTWLAACEVLGLSSGHASAQPCQRKWGGQVYEGGKQARRDPGVLWVSSDRSPGVAEVPSVLPCPCGWFLGSVLCPCGGGRIAVSVPEVFEQC